MKYLFVIGCLLLSVMTFAQEPASAAKGVAYGAGTSSEGAISVNNLEKNFKNNKFEGKVSGKVVEVCQEKGCWMKVERPNGENLMVKFKDYGFFMP